MLWQSSSLRFSSLSPPPSVSSARKRIMMVAAESNHLGHSIRTQTQCSGMRNAAPRYSKLGVRLHRPPCFKSWRDHTSSSVLRLYSMHTYVFVFNIFWQGLHGVRAGTG